MSDQKHHAHKPMIQRLLRDSYRDGTKVDTTTRYKTYGLQEPQVLPDGHFPKVQAI